MQIGGKTHHSLLGRLFGKRNQDLAKCNKTVGNIVGILINRKTCYNPSMVAIMSARSSRN